MSIYLDKIEVIMERAKVTRRQAQEALDKNNGNLVETLINLEKKDRVKEKQEKNINHKGDIVIQRIIEQCKTIHGYQLIIQKEKKNIIKLPLTIVGLIVGFTFPFSLCFLGLLFFTSLKIFIKTKDKEYIINDIVKETKDDH